MKIGPVHSWDNLIPRGIVKKEDTAAEHISLGHRSVEPTGPEVAETATKPLSARLQKHSPGGCIIDMPPAGLGWCAIFCSAKSVDDVFVSR